MAEKKVIYIAGPITGVDRYWEAFEDAEERFRAAGYVTLVPSRLPKGMTNAQYARINFAHIDSADAVYFLPGWDKSKGATLEQSYCDYINKPRAFGSLAEIDRIVRILEEEVFKR